MFPRVNNPWNVEYTAGGSSGGSAAAVAAGLSPLDIGNDIAGSVRQPAHFYGIYSLKPTDRRISTAGLIPEVPGMPYCLRQMMTVGCFARARRDQLRCTLDDLRLCFSLIAGADPRRPDVPPVPLGTPSGKSLPDLKIAWTEQWAEVLVASDIRTAMQQIVEKLEQSGVQIHPWLPDGFDLSASFNLYSRVAAYINRYAQPADRYNLQRSLKLIFRTATQGEKKL